MKTISAPAPTPAKLTPSASGRRCSGGTMSSREGNMLAVETPGGRRRCNSPARDHLRGRPALEVPVVLRLVGHLREHGLRGVLVAEQREQPAAEHHARVVRL